jgi:sigma-B regulation protein RsbU (phosphoserine phosphatase)
MIDPRTGELTYCNAGHNPPLLLRSDGTVEWLRGGGTVLGILPEIGYEEMRRPVVSGDAVVLYSDGVTESTGPAEAEFGESRLEQVLRDHRHESARGIVDAVNGAVAEWSTGIPPADDVTLVVVKRL